MTSLVFVDTNVLIYRVDATEPEKQRLATAWLEALWSERSARISWQVLIEFYNNIRRKVSGISAEFAQDMVLAYMQWQPIVTDLALFRRAWALQDSYSLSWWDALIVAAASVAGCRYLLSEDLQYDQELDGVRLISPFEHTPADILRA